MNKSIDRKVIIKIVEILKKSPRSYVRLDINNILFANPRVIIKLLDNLELCKNIGKTISIEFFDRWIHSTGNRQNFDLNLLNDIESKFIIPDIDLPVNLVLDSKITNKQFNHISIQTDDISDMIDIIKSKRLIGEAEFTLMELENGRTILKHSSIHYQIFIICDVQYI